MMEILRIPTNDFLVFGKDVMGTLNLFPDAGV